MKRTERPSWLGLGMALVVVVVMGLVFGGLLRLVEMAAAQPLVGLAAGLAALALVGLLAADEWLN